MSTRHISLREAVSRHEPGRGKRYPEALERRVVEYARARRARGASWSQLASELGLRYETVRRWVERGNKSKGEPKMRAVAVVPEHAGATISIVTPSGVRVEGITLDDAMALLRALG
jgi:orotate phosphoribosyltransferase-like protein